MPIIQNASRSGNFTVRATSNETYVIPGNTTVSNVVSADDVTPFFNVNNGAPLQLDANVVVVGCYLRQILWSTNGEITIANSSNIMYNLFGTGEFNLETFGMAANDFISANLVIGFTGNGTVLIKAKKVVKFTSEY